MTSGFSGAANTEGSALRIVSEAFDRGHFSQADLASLTGCDGADKTLPDAIIRAASMISPEQHAEYLPPLFEKLCSLEGDAFGPAAASLFYKNPLVLDMPLLGFIKKDPQGEKQNSVLMSIFNPRRLKDEIFSIRAAQDGGWDAHDKQRSLEYLAEEADDIQNRPVRRGMSDVLACIADSLRKEKEAQKLHEQAFPDRNSSASVAVPTLTRNPA
jgi:hypothetical protein